LLYNRLLEFLDVYKSKIPKELEEEIYLAEANTEAAKDRGQRVALYIVLSIVGVSIASFNGFLTEMRSDSNFSDLEQARFNWVGANPIFSFFSNDAPWWRNWPIMWWCIWFVSGG